tara:strand:- start:153 stop:503 length:351 start_codon:yes stop_codon:yes gene_type:complete
MTYIIYHNPNCSKSRKALEILRSRGAETKIIEYLKNPPTKNELQEILIKLNISPKDLIRFKDEKAKELRISYENEFSFDHWISILVENPKLIERPIVISDTRAVIGRPPENVRLLF